MLNQAEIIEYAIKGINGDIEELEKKVKQGYKYIEQYENGIKPKTPLTTYEIKVVIRKANTEIEQLVKAKDELKWQLVELEQ